MSADPKSTWVIRIDDDSPVPVMGRVIGWEDEDRCLVLWGDAAYGDGFADDDRTDLSRVEYADELVPWRRSA